MINILDSSIYNRIAAGEVVERPRSVVKELVENSIDAKATAVSITIKNGGIDYIRIADNGCGMSADDLNKAFLPHATSKISCVDDLDSIATLGFRGEALSSIAAVARVKMVSRRPEDEVGSYICYDNGVLVDCGECGCPVGTTVTVENLFEKIPARKKFLAKASTEEAEIMNLISRLIITNNNVSIRFTADEKQIYHSDGCGAASAIKTVYGLDFLENLYEISLSMSDITIKGYVSKPSFSKHNRTYQTLIINGRYVANPEISFAIFNCYKDYLMSRQYPVYIIFLTLPYDMVDVNVHPNKMEVKFADERRVVGCVASAVKRALYDITAEASVADFGSKIKSTAYERPERLTTVTENAGGYNVKKIYSAPVAATPLRESPFKDVVHSVVDNENTRSTEYAAKKLPDASQNRNIGLIKEASSSNDEPAGDYKIKSTAPQKTNVVAVQQDFAESEAKLIGTLFGTYIVLQKDEIAYFIDQHAAHERILYDKLREELNREEQSSQPLMLPYLFNLTHAEAELFKEYLPKLSEFGFSFSDFGGNSYSLSAVPARLSGMNLALFVSDLMLSLRGGKVDSLDFIKDKIATAACKAAVKGGNELSREEINCLMKKVAETDVMYCPHGRPIAVKVKKSEMEKWFKRLV